MFVFAADDVSKKDLKKISKKIERQLAKWEKKDQENEKRKVETDTDNVETSDTRVKRFKAGDKSDSDKDDEIQTGCSVEHESAVSKGNDIKGTDFFKETDADSDTENIEDHQIKKASASDLEECDLIIDVNEKGVCSFTVISDDDESESQSVENFHHIQSDEITENQSKIADVSHKSSCIVEDTGGNSCDLEECELIVDVTEDGLCNFTVVQDKQNEETNNSEAGNVSFNDSLENCNIFYLCKCGNKSGVECICSRKSSRNDSRNTETDRKLSAQEQSVSGNDKFIDCDNQVNTVDTLSNCYQSCFPAIRNNKRKTKKEIIIKETEQEPDIVKVVIIDKCDCEKDIEGEHKSKICAKCDVITTSDNEENSSKCDIRNISDSDFVSEVDIESDASVLTCERELLKVPEECNIVALDCEFVGVGPKDQSALGRCSIVDFHGNIICDIYARPEERITNYRTRWSGITKHHMKRSIPLQSALSQIANIIRDKVVVGHALQNDFLVLGLPHPKMFIRDTAFYRPLKQRLNPPIDNQSVSLKKLALQLLGRVIQTRQHCSIEDSRAAMDVYKLVRDEWENRILQGKPVQDEIVRTSNSSTSSSAKRRERKNRQREKLSKNKSSVSLFLDRENNRQRNNCRRSKSDTDLVFQQLVYENRYVNTECRHDSEGNYDTEGCYDTKGNYMQTEDQDFLQDEYWQDAFDDESFNSFSDSYE